MTFRKLDSVFVFRYNLTQIGPIERASFCLRIENITANDGQLVNNMSPTRFEALTIHLMQSVTDINVPLLEQKGSMYYTPISCNFSSKKIILTVMFEKPCTLLLELMAATN
jgi:hypothetical protein